MPSQTPSLSRVPACQSLMTVHANLAYVGSWVSVNSNTRVGTANEADNLLSYCENNIRGPPDRAQSQHLLDTARRAPMSSGTIAVNSTLSTSELLSHHLTIASLSSCKDSPSRLEIWAQDFQRHEDIASRLARG